MDDDFNTPKACGVLFDFIKEANRALDKDETVSKTGLLAIKKFIEDTAVSIFGITSFEKKEASTPSRENELIELLITARIEAKKAKQYGLSDFIRDELKKLGIILQDGKDKTTFKLQ
jgi:cysteinyl-tRNA synthetase